MATNNSAQVCADRNKSVTAATNSTETAPLTESGDAVRGVAATNRLGKNTSAEIEKLQAAHRRRIKFTRNLPLLTTLPFFIYIAVFLLLPTAIVVWGGFTNRDGSFTFENLLKITTPNVVQALLTSVFVSAASATIGAVVGATCAYLLVTLNPDGIGKRLMLALSSVLAQFGGVMLAFAFIATIGINGIGTQLIFAATGYQMDPNWLSSLTGLIVIYSYFQIPLMIIVFIPAVGNIRPQWREANASLGGSNWTYWIRVAGPILWPRFLGSWILLFANAFSAYATAAALFAQRSILVPLMIQGALRNEQDTGQNGVAQALAIIMVLVVGLVMLLYSWIQRRTAKWD